ncbi:MAG: YraN family protein [Gemmatimonadota bacterium]|nr:YraN family protein [Gemmatimonadota bacterium]MDE2871290.1 YraN family protein [Gemmatimonadota bacterium]
MENRRLRLGRRGEDLAAAYLEERDWTILARNYRAGPREIDLVAMRGRVVAFVEVKTRATATGGTPLEPIRWTKQRAVEAAARRWIIENGQPGVAYRFDAVAVRIRHGRHEIEHVRDAWRPGGR